jgi:hypothetical protein
MTPGKGRVAVALARFVILFSSRFYILTCCSAKAA